MNTRVLKFDTNKLMIVFIAFAVSMVLLLSTSLKAGAYTGWTTAHDQPGIGVVLLCKRAVNNSVYGPLWEVNIAALSSPGTAAGGNFTITRNGAHVNGVSINASNGQWKSAVTYASRWYNDYIYGTAGAGYMSNGEGAGGNFDNRTVSSLANCQ